MRDGRRLGGRVGGGREQSLSCHSYMSVTPSAGGMSSPMADHAEIIRLVIAYTLVGAFVFTAVVTCLSLIGVIKFAKQSQQQKLFYVLIVELVAGSLGLFFDFLRLNPNQVARGIQTQSVREADLILTRKTAEALTAAPVNVDGQTPTKFPAKPLGGTTPRPAGETMLVSVKADAHDARVIRVLIDGRGISLNDGQAEVRVRAGEHVVTWFVLGPPRTAYNIVLAQSGSTIFTTSGTVDDNGQEAGAHHFVT